MKSGLILFFVFGLCLAGDAFKPVHFQEFFKHKDPIPSNPNEKLSKSTVENIFVQHLDNFDNQNSARFEQVSGDIDLNKYLH